MELRVDEALDVRHVAADLDREHEAGRRFRYPARHGARARQPVEGVVELDGVEELSVVAQPARRRAPLRIEDAVPPVGVVPARTADSQVVSAVAIRRHSSMFPAATTRERAVRSSGQAPSGGASTSSIAKPRSRTMSWAAAKSTGRAGFRQTTASVRPAARWQ